MTEHQACNPDRSGFKAQANSVNPISVCVACALTLDTDGATTPQDDWHCTWWSCPAVTAAPQYCGSLPPGTALAYFPGEEDDKESWTQQRETTCVTAGIP